LIDQTDSEDQVNALFFELSSDDRKRILSALQDENLKLSDLGKRLDLTATEVFRQLERLTGALLIQRLSNGRYQLTSYARLVLTTSSPLGFIARYRAYFLDHDASLLPDEFRMRLAELSGGKMGTDLVESMNKTTEMLRDAHEKIDVMVDRGLTQHGEIVEQRLKEGVKVRFILQKSMLSSIKPSPRPRGQPRPETRSIPRICGTALLTENMAAFSLQRNDGKLSEAGFYGEDANFLRWVGDLFEHEWQKAKVWYP
jgi:predicted transcriptional regulator